MEIITAATIALIVGLAAGYVFSQLVLKGRASVFERQLEELRDKEKALGAERDDLRYKNARLEEKAAQATKLEGELVKAASRNEALAEKNTDLEKEVSALETSLGESREKFQMLNEAEDKLKAAFENLSNRIFEESSSRFSMKNKESIDAILNPLKTQLSEFKIKVEDVYVKEAKDRTALYEQVKSLKDLNEQISRDAVNLTHALKGDVKTQGAWGEVVLERVFEESGLRRGHEYETQLTFKDDGGGRKRPDAIVRLPDNRDVVVDAKVSLVAYERYQSAEDESTRSRALKEHVASIRNHIKGLSAKNYEELDEIRCLDYVLMFIPIEPAFMTAIENDREVFSEAFDKNIVIVSPSTLLVTLKTIHNIWRYEQQTQNAKEIAKKAGDLYDKFHGFVDSLENIGKNIDRAKDAYNTAFDRLSKGKGNLIKRTEDIRKLGVKTKKVLPGQLTDNALGEENLIEDVEEEN